MTSRTLFKYHSIWVIIWEPVLSGLLIGLVHGIKLRRPIAIGQPIACSDVETDETGEAMRVRRETARIFAPASRRGDSVSELLYATTCELIKTGCLTGLFGEGL